uniref:Uncharacterized protein n=1 Tax=Dunaliella tertiolecta TaxID=3047 RepID=A0A7S3QX54_DUNTE
MMLHCAAHCVMQPLRIATTLQPCSPPFASFASYDHKGRKLHLLGSDLMHILLALSSCGVCTIATLHCVVHVTKNAVMKNSVLQCPSCQRFPHAEHILPQPFTASFAS